MGGRFFTVPYAEEWEGYIKEAPFPEGVLRRISQVHPPAPPHPRPRPPMPEKRNRAKNLAKIKVK
jgi:hypothetical protein